MALRTVVLALAMSSAALMVSGEEVEDDVDRSDFTEEYLKEDKEAINGPHSEVEAVWIFPELPDGNVPLGVTSHLLVALSNSGSKMFNVTKITGVVQDLSGKELFKLKKHEYGEPLGPRQQRSFRYPFVPNAELTPGKYLLAFTASYTNREKDIFQHLVCNETTELVLAPLTPMDKTIWIVGGAAVAAVLLVVTCIMLCTGGIAGAKKEGKRGDKAEGASKLTRHTENEWLQGTLAGSEKAKVKIAGKKRSAGKPAKGE